MEHFIKIKEVGLFFVIMELSCLYLRAEVIIDFINLVIDFKIEISVHFDFIFPIILYFDFHFDLILSLDLGLLRYLMEVHQAT